MNTTLASLKDSHHRQSKNNPKSLTKTKLQSRISTNARCLQRETFSKKTFLVDAPFEEKMAELGRL
jgi:hypothetical protein